MNTREQMQKLNAAICQITALYGEWARQHGVTYNTIEVLCALDQTQPCAQSRISRERNLPKQTVHTIVKELERRGWVCFAAGRDQKEKLLSFTPEGRRCAGALLEEMYELEDRTMKAMGPALWQAMLDGTLSFAGELCREVRRGT